MPALFGDSLPGSMIQMTYLRGHFRLRREASGVVLNDDPRGIASGCLGDYPDARIGCKRRTFRSFTQTNSQAARPGDRFISGPRSEFPTAAYTVPRPKLLPESVNRVL